MELNKTIVLNDADTKYRDRQGRIGERLKFSKHASGHCFIYQQIKGRADLDYAVYYFHGKRKYYLCEWQGFEGAVGIVLRPIAGPFPNHKAAAAALLLTEGNRGT